MSNQVNTTKLFLSTKSPLKNGSHLNLRRSLSCTKSANLKYCSSSDENSSNHSSSNRADIDRTICSNNLNVERRVSTMPQGMPLAPDNTPCILNLKSAENINNLPYLEEINEQPNENEQEKVVICTTEATLLCIGFLVFCVTFWICLNLFYGFRQFGGVDRYVSEYFLAFVPDFSSWF